MSEILVVSARTEEAKLRLSRNGSFVRMGELIADSSSTTVEQWSGESTWIVRFMRNPEDTPSLSQFVTAESMQRRLADGIGGDAVVTPKVVSVSAPRVIWRTMWVTQNESYSILSTSLRLCAYLLGDVLEDKLAPVQFLATGTLGPNRSWDRRVRQLRPLERIEVHTATGDLISLVQSERESMVPELDLSDSDAKGLLRDRITESMASIPSDERWVLPLSGGYDSRALLLMSSRPHPTITWGEPESLDNKGSDSRVAQLMAEAVGVEHQFVAISDPHLDPSIVIDRFVAASEGRVDHIDGYLDGMKLWRDLSDSGVYGILRGDQAFGDGPLRTDCGVRRGIGAVTEDEIQPNELSSLVGNLHNLWGRPRRSGETLPAYRDSIYREFRGPAILASLSGIKTNFLDVRCPLLTKEVVDPAISLSDDQRTNKRAFASVVEQLTPHVPFATRSALTRSRMASRPAVQSMLKEEIRDQKHSIASNELRDYLCRPPGDTSPKGMSPLMRRARRLAVALVPRQFVKRLARRAWDQPTALSADAVRLRVVIADRAIQLLRDVAAAGVADADR